MASAGLVGVLADVAGVAVARDAELEPQDVAEAVDGAPLGAAVASQALRPGRRPALPDLGLGT